MVSALKFGLLGHPVGHSVSPAIHQAAYDAFELPHRYEVCDCPEVEDVQRQVAALREGHWAGLNVTVPWKRVALQLADEVDDSARETRAANVLVRGPSGRLWAHNTDAPALAKLLAANIDLSRSTDALIIGNGGAALAAVVAAKRAGAQRVFVTARRWQPTAPHWPAREEFESLGAAAVSYTRNALAEVAINVALLVQATSAGMRSVGGGEELAEMMPWSELPKSVFAYDVVYNPEVTPFMARARATGVRAESGLSMLVGQAALALELWLGVEPPLPVLMRRARQAVFGHEERAS